MPKYAFITGASRGIGAAIAHELATQGYHLYLTCLTNGQRLQSLADELSQTYSVSCQCFVGDIGDYSFVERCFAKINTLDVLVNNAGISYVGLLSDMEVSDWNQVMHTNLSAQEVEKCIEACVTGCKVQHRKYGTGEIISGDGRIAEILFFGENTPRKISLPIAFSAQILTLK